MTAYLDNRVLVERLGSKWLLNENEGIDYEILHGRSWEVAGTSLVERVVKPGMVVYDVGANIGWYTVLAARLVGEEGHVYAFEPMDEPRQILANHVDLNDLKHVAIFDLALSDEDRQESQAIPYSNPRDGVVLNAANVVHYRRIDDFGLKPHFIKIDTDGHEAHVLRGAEQTIRDRRPILFFEVGDWCLRHHAGVAEEKYTYGAATRSLFAWLSERGYVYRYEGTPEQLSTVDDLLAAHDLTRNTINVLAWPEERPWR